MPMSEQNNLGNPLAQIPSAVMAPTALAAVMNEAERWAACAAVWWTSTWAAIFPSSSFVLNRYSGLEVARQEPADIVHKLYFCPVGDQARVAALQKSLMKSYGQFCPVAKAAELFCERWTLLIVRDLA